MRGHGFRIKAGVLLSRHHLRYCLLAVLAAGALLLAGCGVDEDSLTGVWEGRTPDTTYVFSLQPDGVGRLRISASGRTTDTPVSWAVSGDRLKLSRDRGMSTTFKILNQSESELTLRVGGSANGVCRLQKIGLR